MTIDDAVAGRGPWGEPVPYSPAEPVAPVEPGRDGRPRESHRSWPLGRLAFGISVVLVVAEGVAVYLGSTGEPVGATILGQVLVVITAFPFAIGLLAAIRKRNRAWGIAAMVLAVIANPFILVNLLGFFGAF